MQYFRPVLPPPARFLWFGKIWKLLFSYSHSAVQSVKVGNRNNLQFKSRSVIKMMLVLTIFTCHSAVGYSLYLRKNATRVPVISVINRRRVTWWGQPAKVLVKIFWLQFNLKSQHLRISTVVCKYECGYGLVYQVVVVEWVLHCYM